MFLVTYCDTKVGRNQNWSFKNSRAFAPLKNFNLLYGSFHSPHVDGKEKNDLKCALLNT